MKRCKAELLQKGTSQRASRRDRIQVAAFQAAFKSLLQEEYSPDEAFGKAIRLTDDDQYEQAVFQRPELIKQWLEMDAKRRRRY